MNGQVGHVTENGPANPVAGDEYRYGVSDNSTTSGQIGNTGGSAGTSGWPFYHSNGSTPWVTSNQTAWTAHGASGGSRLNLSNQSTIGFAPSSIGQIQTGQLTNIGRMVHVNRPISPTGNFWYRGDMNISFLGMNLTFGWQMNETTNQCTGANCSDDFVNFRNQISPQTFTFDDLT